MPIALPGVFTVCTRVLLLVLPCDMLATLHLLFRSLGDRFTCCRTAASGISCSTTLSWRKTFEWDWRRPCSYKQGAVRSLLSAMSVMIDGKDNCTTAAGERQERESQFRPHLPRDGRQEISTYTSVPVDKKTSATGLPYLKYPGCCFRIICSPRQLTRAARPTELARMHPARKYRRTRRDRLQDWRSTAANQKQASLSPPASRPATPTISLAEQSNRSAERLRPQRTAEKRAHRPSEPQLTIINTWREEVRGLEK